MNEELKIQEEIDTLSKEISELKKVREGKELYKNHWQVYTTKISNLKSQRAVLVKRLNKASV